MVVRGLPFTVVSDNGTELTSTAILRWRARLSQRAAVLACAKAAARPLGRWPSASLDPSCATARKRMTEAVKQRSTEQRNVDTMGVAATTDANSE